MRATLRRALAALAASAVVSAVPSSSSSSSSGGPGPGPAPDDQPPRKPLLSDFDALGAWFEGVAAINATTDPADLARARNATVAIVGAGVAGLATALMLDSVGLRRWELIEAGPRVGGRLRTVFVGGTDEWAEMGPMRLPRRLTLASDNATLEYSDHAMVWQLADALNARNAAAGRDDLRVDFIPWIQHSPNELLALGTGRLPGTGAVPTRAEVAADPETLAEPAPLDTGEYRAVKARMDAILQDEETLRSIVRDPWRAHRRAMDRGLDDVSQQAMMRLAWNASEQVVDAIRTSTDYDVFWDEMTHNANLAQDGGSGAAGLTEWWCVDRGFSRIGEAFLPLVRDRLVLNRQVRSIEAVPSSSSSASGPDNQQQQHNVTRLSWVDSGPADRANQSTAAPAADGSQSRDYDYTVVSAPFTMTRMMTALPPFSPQLKRAISERGLRFKDACKVALLFRERFWERGDRPIFGGKSEPADAAMGALYYPVYNLNETGRPGLIMQYRGGDWSSRFGSLAPDEHAARALDAVASLHGEERTREHYTGVYERQCWLDEPSVGTSWARPDVAQHRAYIPAYHATEHRTVFIGEHTAPTHAWVSSSLHSAARGTVQLLLDMGLVDEAKRVNREWMGRWL